MTTTEDTVKQVIAKVGLWWPAADEDKLRAAATAYRAFATDIDALSQRANTAATAVTAANQAASVDQFRTLWQNYDGSCQGYLPGLANAARAMASACDQFADAVVQAKNKIRELAVTIGATLVVGTVLAFFTFGIAEGAALATSASLVSAGAAVGLELSSTAMLIVSSALVGAAFGAVEGAALDVAVAQPIRVWGFHDGGFSLSELESSFVYGGAGGLVFGGAGAGVRAWRLGGLPGEVPPVRLPAAPEEPLVELPGQAPGAGLPPATPAVPIKPPVVAAAEAGSSTAVRGLSQAERTTLEDALRPDKLDHIFDPKHNFGPLIKQFGSREGALEQIVRSIGGPLPASGPFKIAQSIGGQTVVIRGAIVNGVPRIGTAFTP